MTQEARLDYSDQPEFTDRIKELLLDTELPFGVDWTARASELSMNDRLLRLARLKAILPAGNAANEKNTHDVTLENYIRLALDAAGDTETLDLFLSHLSEVLERNPKAQTLAQQVFWIWGPAAEIAGMYQHKEDLEDLAFGVLMPGEYEQLSLSYEKDLLESHDGLFGKTKEEVKVLLQSTLGNVTDFELQNRAKSNYSVWRKLRSEKRQSAELFDLLGFRVIIDGDDEAAIGHCYAAMAAVAGGFESELTRLKDYISNPKANGYQSLHLTLYTETGFPFELQVRTRAMHTRAESNADMSHQTYDAAFKEVPGKIQKTYRRVPKLYRWRDDAMQHILANDGKIEGFMDGQLLFFRDDGNLYLLPEGATIMDASFRMHSHRALRTWHIYDRSRPTALSGEVKHGAVLSVDYKKNYPTKSKQIQRIHKLVETKSSRKAIEKGWRELNEEALREKGRMIIATMVKELGLEDPFEVLDDVDRRELADKIGVSTFDSLLELVGAGNTSSKPARVARYIRERVGLGPVAKIKTVRETMTTLKDDQVLSSIRIPSSGEQPECKVAGCCTERIKFGEPVIVRPSRFEGIFKLHKDDCANVRDRSDVIMCSWV